MTRQTTSQATQCTRRNAKTNKSEAFASRRTIPHKTAICIWRLEDAHFVDCPEALPSLVNGESDVPLLGTVQAHQRIRVDVAGKASSDCCGGNRDFGHRSSPEVRLRPSASA